jgi:hypothetical protein
MRRQAIVLLAGTLGLLAVGCGANDNAEVASSPSPEASPAATTATQPFDAPLVSPKDGKDGKNAKVASKTNKVAGLLESTDPEERAKQVQSGIRSRAGLDPFASLPATLQFSLPTGSNGSNGSNGNIASNGLNSGGRPRLGNLPAGGNGSGGPSPLINLGGPRGGGPRGGSTIASINAIPSFPVVEPVRRPTQIARGPVGTNGLNAPGDKGLKPLPPLAEPKLAQAVEVTGVVTIGGITQAIIKAPNEPTGRHVEVGQRLSNGQVLVKRIEANAGSDPIVVFEENGQEVSRGVGEKSTPTTGDSPTV